MALKDTQLKPADEKAGDNNDRNRVKQQMAEPYGDQPLHAESRVTFERHFAGQPLETDADHEANEAVRRERYARAQIDPLYRRQQKIDVAEEDKIVHMREVSVPLVSPVPDYIEDELSEDEINKAEQEYEHKLDDGEADDSEKEVK